MKTSFSEGKLMKKFWNPLFLRRPSPFQLTPYFSAIFSWHPSLSKFKKQQTLPLILEGGDYDGIWVFLQYYEKGLSKC